MNEDASTGEPEARVAQPAGVRRVGGLDVARMRSVQEVREGKAREERQEASREADSEPPRDGRDRRPPEAPRGLDVRRMRAVERVRSGEEAFEPRPPPTGAARPPVDAPRGLKVEKMRAVAKVRAGEEEFDPRPPPVNGMKAAAEAPLGLDVERMRAVQRVRAGEEDLALRPPPGGWTKVDPEAPRGLEVEKMRTLDELWEQADEEVGGRTPSGADRTRRRHRWGQRESRADADGFVKGTIPRWFIVAGAVVGFLLLAVVVAQMMNSRSARAAQGGEVGEALPEVVPLLPSTTPGVLDTGASRRVLEAFLKSGDASEAIQFLHQPDRYREAFVKWHHGLGDATPALAEGSAPKVRIFSETPVHYWRVWEPSLGEMPAPMILTDQGYRLDWPAWIARGDEHWEVFLECEEVEECTMRLLATVPARYTGVLGEVSTLDVFHPSMLNYMTAIVDRAEDRVAIFNSHFRNMREFPVSVRIKKKEERVIITRLLSMDWLSGD